MSKLLKLFYKKLHGNFSLTRQAFPPIYGPNFHQKHPPFLQSKAMASNLRPRPATTHHTSSSDTSIAAAAIPDADSSKKSRLRLVPSTSQQVISQTLTSTANLANLLPTGTLLAFQLLMPIFTNNGACDSVTRLLTVALLAILGLSCFIACFTDSISIDGKVYYGVATFKGLWLLDYPDTAGVGLPDLSNKKIKIIDGIHAVLTVLVFGAVALRDRNVVVCLYPNPGREARAVLDIVPVGIGVMCSLMFVAFPTRRHGVGFPVTPPTT